MAKRVKYVYSTSEVPHLFASGNVNRASNPQHNLSFENNVITSYGHWPIGARVTNHKGKTAILLRSDRYSVTTSKQQSDLRFAVRHLTSFEVPSMASSISNKVDHKINIGYYVSMAKDELGKAERARSYAESHYERALKYRDDCLQYAAFFGEPSPRKLFSFLPTGAKLDALKEQMWDRKVKHDAANDEKYERARLARVERERIEALEMPEKIALWRTGEYVASAYRFPTMLRISKDGQNVETSRGAVVPLSHAKRGLAFVRKVVASGTEYVRNGHTLHLGHYTIDRIEVDGTLHAGCHVIPYAEIESIAPALVASAIPAHQTDAPTLPTCGQEWLSGHLCNGQEVTA